MWSFLFSLELRGWVSPVGLGDPRDRNVVVVACQRPGGQARQGGFVGQGLRSQPVSLSIDQPQVCTKAVYTSKWCRHRKERKAVTAERWIWRRVKYSLNRRQIWLLVETVPERIFTFIGPFLPYVILRQDDIAEPSNAVSNNQQLYKLNPIPFSILSTHSMLCHVMVAEESYSQTSRSRCHCDHWLRALISYGPGWIRQR